MSSFAPRRGSRALLALVLGAAGVVLVGPGHAAGVGSLDPTPPGVAFTEPSIPEPYLSGIYPLRAQAWYDPTTSSDIHKVQFLADGVLLGEDFSYPYALDWDTRTVPDRTGLTLTARVYDTSGLEGRHELTSVVVDNTAPVLALSGPAGAVQQRASYIWDVVVTEASPRMVTCSVVPAGRPEAWAACSSASQHTTDGLPLGDHELDVQVVDQAGNRTQTTRRFTVVPAAAPPPQPPPSVAPDTVVDERPPARVRTAQSRARVRVAFHATLTGARFECRIDRSRWRSCSSVWRPRLSVGRHVLRVRALIRASVDSTPATVRVRVRRR